MKFFFGASGLRKFGFEALFPPDCPGRDEAKPPPPWGRLPAGDEGPPEPTGRNGLREAPFPPPCPGDRRGAPVHILRDPRGFGRALCV